MSLNTPSYPLLFSLASLVIILTGVKLAEAIISPLLIALFITAISGPAMFWLLNKKVPASLAVSLIIFTLIIFGFFISSIVSSSLQGFFDNLPSYQDRLQSITKTLGLFLQQFGINLQMTELSKTFNLGKVMGFIGSTFNQVLSALTNIFLILIMVIFLLLELTSFRLKLSSISKTPTETMAKWAHISATISRYFKIKTMTSLLTAIPIILVLSLLEIDFPILWGIVAFLLNFVPNIGSIIAAVPAVLLALIQFGFIAAGEVALLYLLMNNIVGNFIEPRLMGRSLGLSTLVVFLSLVLWGWLLGPIGMFLSVPLTMALKIISDSNEKTRWIAILLSNDIKNVKKT
ncbi:AI-2E family transporter [sulfur-oxidizing endosymbiont of Gigantopelta aegis]|uniref:AI-2E family transporter n=1 Tax=sulfur-oxidizing endosymbiont of Gigantopelta aegis TaxID=2794934 RepID=UPI0018DD92B9|nr:AI-2E family transporter [sulfur-oxidizing endosymbiont of Gigantopelta aegis]